MPIDPLVALRSATVDAHEDLERKLDLPGRWLRETDADRRREDYRQLLSRYLLVYGAVEEHLGLSAARLPLHGRDQSKADWLREDLRALGGAEELPAPAPITTDRSGVLLGYAYVVEGSMLGGAVILREMRRAGWGLPCRFFTGHGPDTGRRWREFRTELSAWVEATGQLSEVIDGAHQAFAYFESHTCGVAA